MAFGLTLDVGIDIEHLRIDRNVVELAKPLFSPSEYRQLLMKPQAERKRDFLQAWIRREAVGKALGVGISLTPGAYERTIADASEWSMCNIEAAEHYVAALAAWTPVMHVRLWDCQS
jgi:4'-phosphopantetheinyl transferase